MVIVHLEITYMPINVREYYFSTLSLEILHYSISTLMAMWSAYIVFTIHLQSVSKQISNVDTKEADVPSTPKVSEDKPGQRFVYSYL
jgi:hypothetical protein